MQVQSKKRDLLGQFPLFQTLSNEALDKLVDRFEVREYGRHESVYRLDAPSDHVFFLARGIIKISSWSDDGREIIKQILHPIAMFGEMGLIGEAKRRDEATCLDKNTTLYVIPTASLSELLQNEKSFMLEFLKWIGQRLQRTEARLEAMIFKDARKRIIDFLIDTANKQGRRVGYEMLIRHCLTQQDIANLTGTSRQTVTSVLNELKKSNLIHFNRRTILIRDLSQLR